MKQIDNRGSNFYVALYWAEELAAKDPSWAPLAQVSVFFKIVKQIKVSTQKQLI